MKLLQPAAAVLLVLLAAGCAHKPMASAPAPAAAPTPSGPVAVVPPMTTYGCDPIIARRMGRAC